MITMHRKSRKKLLIALASIAVVVLFLVSVLQLSGVINLFADDYGTGMNLDTSANFYSHTKNYDPLKGQEWCKGAGAEILTRDKYIVAWQSEQLSSLVTCRADFQYHARARCEGFNCAYGYWPGILLGRYWCWVNYVDIDGVTHKIIDTKNNYFDPEYVYWVRGADSSRYKAGEGHHLPNIFYDIIDDTTGDLLGKEWFMPWTEYEDNPQWYTMSTDTIEFKLKGNLVGGLKYGATIEYAERENTGDWWGWRWHTGTADIGSDEAYLASGEGEVIITSTNAVANDGSGVTDETNIVYTKYVYEEGLEVVMSVDAGYSGASLDPDEPGYNQGWVLEIYDSAGASKYSEYIPDNVRGHRVTYTIPAGAFIPNDPGDNEWRVVLKNTLFDQSETRLFVIDKFEYMPGQTTITTDKNRYVQWETVTVTLTANSNVQTGRAIDHFKVWAKYGSVGSVDYAYTEHDLTAQTSNNWVYTASFSFQLIKGNTNVYIRAHAIDDESRAGAEGEHNIFSEQAVGNYQVNVIVTDERGLPVQGALASLGASSATSTANGIATLYVVYGSQALSVSKAGYSTYSQSGIQVQSDMTLPVTLVSDAGLGAFGQYIWYILGAIIAVVAVLVALVYMKRNKMWVFGKRKRRK